MVMSFCGHSDYVEKEGYRERVVEVIRSITGDDEVSFFLGEYGAFDKFAYVCAKGFKKMSGNAKLVFVTPYLSEVYLIKRFLYEKDRFDEIIYPEIENVHLKYAILKRNEWIVDQSDVIIACVEREYGGAFATYKYAKRKGKKIYNIAEEDM